MTAPSGPESLLSALRMMRHLSWLLLLGAGCVIGWLLYIVLGAIFGYGLGEEA